MAVGPRVTDPAEGVHEAIEEAILRRVRDRTFPIEEIKEIDDVEPEDSDNDDEDDEEEEKTKTKSMRARSMYFSSLRANRALAAHVEKAASLASLLMRLYEGCGMQRTS